MGAQTLLHQPGRKRLRPTRAFAGMALIFVAFLAAAAAPSPLYVLYQEQWGFDSWLLSLAFAVYAFALLAALLVGGSLSDYIGRRPVLIGSLLLQLVAMTLLLIAGNIETVILARVIQGAATGVATGALSAALTDLEPRGQRGLGGVIGSLAPLLGLALGALATGILVQTTPAPIPETFVALDVLFAVAIVVVWAAPESTQQRPGALKSLTPRMSVPASARTTFARSTFLYIAVWMTSGFYLGLISLVLRDVFDIRSGLLNGALIAGLAGVGAFSVFLTRHVSAANTAISGGLALIAGVSVIGGSILGHSLAALLTGTVVAGFGFGTGFAGCIRLVIPLAKPEQRGELFAAVYFVSYLAFGAPAILAGILVGIFPLLVVAVAYAALTVVCAIVGTIAQLNLRTRTSRFA